MYFESMAVETADPERPFLARVTTGLGKWTRVIEEWPAPSLEAAEQQADDWTAEYVLRLGGSSHVVDTGPEADARRARLELLKNLPPLPAKIERQTTPDKAPPRRTQRPAQALESAIDQRPPSATERRRYPTAARVNRYMAAGRKNGLDVAAFRVWPDGSIAVYDARAVKVVGLELEEEDTWADFR